MAAAYSPQDGRRTAVAAFNSAGPCASVIATPISGHGSLRLVTMADGRKIRYQVVARERFDKEVVPMDRIFDRGGEPRLTLVTCGGAFDRSSGHYRDNIVVTAVPLS